MGTTAGVGFSLLRGPADAGKEAALQALEQGGIAKPDFVFVFATVGYDQQALIDSIRATTQGAPLSGCSGEGVITRGMAAETNFGVCVMAIASDELSFANVAQKELGMGFEAAGARLADQVRPLLATDTIAGFLFVDGLVFDFDPFREAFEKALALEKSLPLFGGLAADNWTTGRTFQYHNGEVFLEGASCVIMSGRANIAWGVNHGCIPVGTGRTITRSKGNIIYQIDGVPALDALKDYMEDASSKSGKSWNKTTLNLCLGFKAPDYLKRDYGEFIIRYMMDKDDAEGYVTIQSDVKEGTELWLMRRDKELMREGLHTIAQQIRAQVGERRPKFVLHFECMGRGKVVYREQEKIDLLKSLQEDVGESVPWIGFYSYGEIGPVAEHNCIHNFTAVVVAVY